MLSSLLGEPAPGDANGVFRERAVALVGTLTPVLVWMRDHKNVPLNIETIRLSFELRSIWKVATKRVFEVRNPMTGETTDIPVPEMPEDLIYPLQAYLGELPSYDMSLDWNRQKTEEPSKQHGFAQFYFTHTFQLLGVSLGHIFKVRQSDVDMRDVVLNRRILVVNLPALESSDERLAALGKIVVASLRGMMAQMLGARLEGDSDVIVANKPGMGVAPFHVVLDEVGYYATSGMDRMLAQGRGLNLMFWLGFQEVSGIWARLGEKTQSLLGNGNLTVAMRQQDANRTREWIEKYRRQDLCHPGDELRGRRDGRIRRKPLGGSPRSRRRRLARSAEPDRGRGDHPLRRPPHPRQALSRRHRPERTDAAQPPRGAGAARRRSAQGLDRTRDRRARATRARSRRGEGREVGDPRRDASGVFRGRGRRAAGERMRRGGDRGRWQSAAGCRGDRRARAPRAAPGDAERRGKPPPESPVDAGAALLGRGRAGGRDTSVARERRDRGGRIAGGGASSRPRSCSAGATRSRLAAELRGAAEEEVARSIRTLIDDMASAAREAAAAASAKEAASPRLSGAIR